MILYFESVDPKPVMRRYRLRLLGGGGEFETQVILSVEQDA